jgi:hypothetical protein
VKKPSFPPFLVLKAFLDFKIMELISFISTIGSAVLLAEVFIYAFVTLYKMHW